MNTLFNIIRKSTKAIYRKVDYLYHLYFNYVIKDASYYSDTYYMERFNQIRENKNDIIKSYEEKCGYSLNKDWMYDLALITQVIPGRKNLCCDHGRVLYSTILKWLKNNPDITNIKILETGTARGFSSVCMAKALEDSRRNGVIITIDILPNNQKVYWNCIADKKGKLKREELLIKWEDLLEKYIIFIQGDTQIVLNHLTTKRFNIAFLDACHTYFDIMAESKYIKERQLTGDIIIYDDYNEKNFPGLVKGVNKFVEEYNYSLEIVKGLESRNYAIAIKK
tara:strand:+ start:2982 stop:3821 length:840 start_codon:yes stop_codon:yes gene_type:complete